MSRHRLDEPVEVCLCILGERGQPYGSCGGTAARESEGRPGGGGRADHQARGDQHLRGVGFAGQVRGHPVDRAGGQRARVLPDRGQPGPRGVGQPAVVLADQGHVVEDTNAGLAERGQEADGALVVESEHSGGTRIWGGRSLGEEVPGGATAVLLGEPARLPVRVLGQSGPLHGRDEAAVTAVDARRAPAIALACIEIALACIESVQNHAPASVANLAAAR